jgi:hypothetical protein
LLVRPGCPTCPGKRQAGRAAITAATFGLANEGPEVNTNGGEQNGTEIPEERTFLRGTEK